MAGTSKSNKKTAETVRERYGVDAHGRSIHHVKIGSKGGENGRGGYFQKLKLTDPAKLAEISSRGGKKKKTEGKNIEADMDTGRPSDPE